MTIDEKTISFLQENAFMNSREWFAEHREEYRKYVEAPMLSLSESIGKGIKKIDPLMTLEPRRTMSRIHKDVRFSKDGTLYREVMWLIFRRGKGMVYPAFFFEFSVRASRYGVGYYNMPAPVMNTIREYILTNDKLFVEATKALKKAPEYTLQGEKFKKTKFPEESEEKREWLDRKGFYISVESAGNELLFSDQLDIFLTKEFIKLAPVYNLFLHAHMMNIDFFN